jgi:homoserine O-acetyltransferase
MPEQTTTQIFDLGDFQLSTGFILPNAKLSYKTHGSLNPAKDNAILFPHFLGGAPEALEIFIGEDRPLDPRKYFIILPGLFGNGFSSSPSNTEPPFDQGAFPQTNIADDVIAQHRLVTEVFNIKELHLVLGWSVGALQTYEWAVRFPNMIKRAASIAGAPKPSPWTTLWLRTAIEEPVVSDPAWNNGFYTDPQAIQGGLRRQAHVMALTLPPLGFYREDEEVWRSMGFISRDDFISRFWEAFMVPQDPNNLITQSRKTRAADPSFGGDLAAALQQIKAKMFVVAFTGDMMFPPEECKRDAQRIPNAQFREISSISGHLTTFALTEQDRQAMDDVLQEILAD